MIPQGHSFFGKTETHRFLWGTSIHAPHSHAFSLPLRKTGDKHLIPPSLVGTRALQLVVHFGSPRQMQLPIGEDAPHCINGRIHEIPVPMMFTFSVKHKPDIFNGNG